jgi:hypothetical protein
MLILTSNYNPAGEYAERARISSNRDHPEMGAQDETVDGGISEWTWGKRGSNSGQELQL